MRSTREKVIGRIIHSRRLKKGWSLTTLARKAGYCKSMVSQIENGNNSLSLDGFFHMVAILKIDARTIPGLTSWKTCPRCRGSGSIR